MRTFISLAPELLQDLLLEGLPRVILVWLLFGKFLQHTELFFCELLGGRVYSRSHLLSKGLSLVSSSN